MVACQSLYQKYFLMANSDNCIKITKSGIVSHSPSIVSFQISRFIKDDEILFSITIIKKLKKLQKHQLGKNCEILKYGS